MSTRPVVPGSVVLLTAVLLMTLSVRPAAARPQAGPATATQASPAGDYVGDDTCLTCHSAIEKTYLTMPHGQKSNPKSPASLHGCETCHGPGKAHVDNNGSVKFIRVFREMRAADVEETCAQCHDRGEHAFVTASTHSAHTVTCTTCHSMHSFKSRTAQLTAPSELQVCATCHRPETNKVLRVMHMPLREGKMVCSSCHNPHGSSSVRMLRVGNSVTELCTSCHAAQRGPFLWEHPVGRETCTVCHDPHGSSNNRMLVAKPPLLCQRCHISTRHPSTIYDLNAFRTTSGNRLFGRGCVECHQNIHGSNHPSGTFFLR